MELGNSLYERYQRQIILKGFGIEAQEKLLGARVLVVGAGGLGCPVLMTLAGAGVGNIGIVDDGIVELSNLHRQFLYNTNDIGKLKIDCAKNLLQTMNPGVKINTYPLQLSTVNALDIIKDYEVVIDCTDNFHSRYMINDACALLGKPLVYGAVSRYEGQAALFNGRVSYRDVFPNPPQESEVANCNEAGVLGVLPNIIGNFMANEYIKLVTGIGDSLEGKLMTYSAIDNQVFTIDIAPTAEGFRLLPKSKTDFAKMDYPSLCGIIEKDKIEIDITEFRTLIKNPYIKIIDVREQDEMPALTDIPHQRIPLSFILKVPEEFTKGGRVIFVCQSGKRSLQAAVACRAINTEGDEEIYSLKGGVNALIMEGILS